MDTQKSHNSPESEEGEDEEIPDFTERMFYISGTRGMVIGLKRILHESGIHQNHVKVDFFPGFA